MEKRRFLDKHDTSEAYQIIGDVRDKTAIIIDDIISTGGTIVQAAASLREAGATGVIALATHGVFAGEAVEKLTHAPIEEVICTNSIHLNGDKKFASLKVVSIAPLLADAISTLVR